MYCNWNTVSLKHIQMCFVSKTCFCPFLAFVLLSGSVFTFVLSNHFLLKASSCILCSCPLKSFLVYKEVLIWVKVSDISLVWLYRNLACSLVLFSWIVWLSFCLKTPLCSLYNLFVASHCSLSLCVFMFWFALLCE